MVIQLILHVDRDMQLRFPWISNFPYSLFIFLLSAKYFSSHLIPRNTKKCPTPEQCKCDTCGLWSNGQYHTLTHNHNQMIICDDCHKADSRTLQFVQLATQQKILQNLYELQENQRDLHEKQCDHEKRISELENQKSS